MKSIAVLKDQPIDIKLKLSLCWTAVTLIYLYGDYFELYVPGKVSGMIEGQSILNTPSKLLLAALLLSLPALMIFFSIFLKPSLNRILNIIVALLLSIVTFLVATDSLSSWRRFYLIMSIVETCITIFIAWTAFKWPKVSTTLTNDQS